MGNLTAIALPWARARGLGLVVVLVAALAGCFRPPMNEPLARFDGAAGYCFAQCPPTAQNTDDVFIILCFSGGGTRAAAFSYGVLATLRDTPIRAGHERLLDEVDVISSASGGSFTAAYYGLYRDRLFQDFQDRFLYRNVEGALELQALSPWNWLRLASPYFGRIDLAAEYYDARLFEHRTFQDLLDQHRRPYIVLNATDMTVGTRFEFTQNQFNLLYSDLARFPVARAVAASSAYPALLSPLTLRNWPRGPDFVEEPWVQEALDSRDATLRRWKKGVFARSYGDQARRPYLHLLDGGVADNVGLRGPLDFIASNDGAVPVLNLINRRKIRKLAVVVVNSESDPDTRRDATATVPWVLDVVMTSASVPISNYTAESVAALQDHFSEWRRSQRDRAACLKLLRALSPSADLPPGPFDAVELYPIEVSFDRVEDPGIQHRLKNIGTNYDLTRSDVDLLIATARQVLEASEDFRRLVRDLAE